jgi:4-carboxymuconolactone decarboxylase
MTSGPLGDPEVAPSLEVLVRISASIASSDWDAVEADFGRLAATNCPPEIVEEMILQLYLFVGFPAALTAARIWRDLFGQTAIDTDPLAVPDRLDEWEARGVTVCRTVYGSSYDALRTNVAGVHPALDRWMVLEGYGKVLGRPGLALWQRELCIVAMLAAGGWAEQLHSHLRGALRAGAGSELVERALDIGLARVHPSRVASLRGVWNRVKSSAESEPDVH